MLLFHRPFSGEEEDLLPFCVTTIGTDARNERGAILNLDQYRGSGEFVDCSDIEMNPGFKNALATLQDAVGERIYDLLCVEFSDSCCSVSEEFDEYPLMYLETRVAGTHLFPLVQTLLAEFYEELDLVIGEIRTRGVGVRSNIRV